ncbi:RNA polymerase sigma factor [Echinicola shivajiensis]|uniref:RNA polymerase sigma factor n=1 Tax=Echinicola shivajiensis TaxID=1035916 RepID=UPI001BFCB963|nr:RNA polymerase sigma-70 factor [Echinicola shivajiensis]
MPLNHAPFEEKTLVRSLKKGNEMAFRSIYDHFFPSLYRYALKFLKSRELAEEVVHDVFLKVWIHRERLNDELPISPYLFKACKNHLINTIEKAAKDPVLLKEVTSSGLCSKEHGPEDLLIGAEFEKTVKDAIKSLPPVRQRVFNLCRVEGKSYEEVADMLGISKGTVNSHIIKANRRLEKVIKLGVGVLILSIYFVQNYL